MMSTPDPHQAGLPVPTTRGRAGARWSVVATVAVALSLPGCGRSAPDGALAGPESTPTASGPPDIAGVTITSPDAVVDPESAAVTASVVGNTEPRGVYVVEAGDTLSVIAGELGVTVGELADFNGLTDVNDLSPGQELLIPPVVPVEVTVEGGSSGVSTTTPAVTTPLVTPAQGAGGTNGPGD